MGPALGIERCGSNRGIAGLNGKFAQSHSFSSVDPSTSPSSNSTDDSLAYAPAGVTIVAREGRFRFVSDVPSSLGPHMPALVMALLEVGAPSRPFRIVLAHSPFLRRGGGSQAEKKTWYWFSLHCTAHGRILYACTALPPPSHVQHLCSPSPLLSGAARTALAALGRTTLRAIAVDTDVPIPPAAAPARMGATEDSAFIPDGVALRQLVCPRVRDNGVVCVRRYGRAEADQTRRP